MGYNPSEIESKWKSFWTENQTYKVSESTDKPKYYVLDMFPYPSGAGLHVGHPLGYIATDIFSRYKVMKGFNVLHPMGFDAFGLPAEQYAIQTGVHPADSTEKNIEQYRKQLDNLGFNYDWSRSVKTCDPSYYKWTQWIFIQLFKSFYHTKNDKAEGIDVLIQYFEENGNINVPAYHSDLTEFDATDWKAFSAKEKDDILMNYRLAYRKVSYVNWCEALGTVLANDEVKDGLSERGGHPVERKAMMQWSLRITAFAERLLNDMNQLEWSDSLKAMQKNWIGKSEGAQLFFDLEYGGDRIEVFTTRPDTIFGASFMVLAPEHDLVQKITTDEQRSAVDSYIEYASNRSERERMSEVKEISGAFTGSYAINPFNGQKIPVWIADYVLKDYGTGAIMAVPSGDERDHAFATHFELPIIEVIDRSKHEGASIGDKVGQLINSEFLNGIEVKDAIENILQKIEEKGIGTRQINYRLRDANYSRQRYWGEPFPIEYSSDGVSSAISLDRLPLELPDLEDFKPASGGRSPLARLDNWIQPGENRTRESDTMPGFAGSSWYFLRYMDANNDQAFASTEALNYWQDVDLYVGGTEHAVGHLMYSRFWHKFLFDQGLVPTNEPFKKLINQGMIQGIIEFIYLQKEKVNGKSRFLCAGLRDREPEIEFVKIPIFVDYVQNYGNENSYLNIESIKQFIEWRPEYKDAIFECAKGTFTMGQFTPISDEHDSQLITVSEVGKMSKRYFNVVNPDHVVDQYGADCFRMYEMFLGPIEQSKPWDTNGIDGVSKFLRRFWSLYYNEDGQAVFEDKKATKDELVVLHETIKKVSDYIEKFAFNTAVSSFMICVNNLKKLNCTSLEVLNPLVRLMAPFAPFVTEELWSKITDQNGSIHLVDYPVFDPSVLEKDSILYPLCVNGKKRSEIEVSSSASKDEVEKMALNHEGIEKWLDGKTVKKVIVVPGRMINLVV